VAAPAGQGASRAAIALVALGAEHAAEVLKHLPEEEAEQLSREMVQLGAINQELLDSVCDDLVAETGGPDDAHGGINFTRDVLVRVVGEARADELIAQFMGAERQPFDFMRAMSAEEICDLLEGESPQTIALVTVNIRSALSGRVLDALEPRVQAEVAHRVATMAAPNPHVISANDRGLMEKAASGFTGGRGEPHADGVDVLAQILQGAGRATERQVLGGLELVDADLAAAVRDRMFTFEDVPKLSDKDLQLVLRDIDTKDLVIALRGAPDDLMDRVVANMSQRAGETLREELELQPALKRAIVEEAQTKVVSSIRLLDEAGSITLPSGSEGEGDAQDELL
jgi:flagellar motor switch protein FliG